MQDYICQCFTETYGLHILLIGIACVYFACIAFCQRISKKIKYMPNKTEM